MTRYLGLVAAAALLVAGAPAHAAPVSTTATLSVDFGGAGGFTLTRSGTVEIAGSGVISVDSGAATGSRLEIPSGLVTLPSTLVVPIPSSASTLVDSVTLQPGLRNGAGTFSIGGASAQAGTGETCAGSPQPGSACVNGGGLGGVLPIEGNLTVTASGGAIAIPIDLGAMNIGVGGAGDAGQVTAEAAPWTTGAGYVNANGVFLEFGSAVSTVSLVSPTYVNLFGSVELPAYATLSLADLEVVPEPGTLGLLGSGVAGLALAGRRRRS